MGLSKASMPVAELQPGSEPVADWPAALQQTDPNLRRQAVRAMRDDPAHAPRLGQHLPQEPDDRVREAAFNSLVAIGGEPAVLALLPLLGLEDANLRNGAIEALKQLPQALAPHMHALLRDADPDRRIFAVNICESLRLAEVETWLLAVIAEDAHVNVCATAVDLLGELGSAAAIAPLQALAARFNGDPFMRFAVNTAIRRIGAQSVDGSPA